MHKSSFWYPAESQGHMWAFLIGGFLKGFFTRLSIGPILTCAWRLGKGISTEGGWQSQRAFTVNSTMKDLFELESFLPEEKMLWETDSFKARICVCKFAYWFSSVFQSLQMYCRVFCNLADMASVKTNQEIMIFTEKNSYSGPGISEQTKETRKYKAI